MLGYRLCEQGLAADPNNVRALGILVPESSFFRSCSASAPKPNADLKRAGANWRRKGSPSIQTAPSLHQDKGFILSAARSVSDESIAEFERTLALNPSIVSAVAGLGSDYLYLGQFEKSFEFFERGDSAQSARSRSDFLAQHKSAALFWIEAIRSGDRVGPVGRSRSMRIIFRLACTAYFGRLL